jgi:excinuclease ABC subunit B
VAYRIEFWGDEIERISSFHPRTGQEYDEQRHLNIYPTNLFVTTSDRIQTAISQIRLDLEFQVLFLKETGKEFEAKRLEERVLFDIEMIQELGHCSGIENYSRYFDGRQAGERPYCLLDYFPDDFLLVVDESHATVPQIRAMYGGDRSRKDTLIEYGFRLPAAKDNRPITFEEFESLTPCVVYVSATPADFELEKCDGVVVEQVVRPTGLLDPSIEVRPSLNQIDDLMEEITQRAEVDERILVTTLTKRMAEDLTEYYVKVGVKARYLHSEIKTLERVELIRDLRGGEFQTLIGINLLREGLDIPEVSLVAVLDADKEGFLRSERSLIQTCGRAARNAGGVVILYADHITGSMATTISETERRRAIQEAHNREHGIVPTTVVSAIKDTMRRHLRQTGGYSAADMADELPQAAEPLPSYGSVTELDKEIARLEKEMRAAAQELAFEEAARLRDRIKALRLLEIEIA